MLALSLTFLVIVAQSISCLASGHDEERKFFYNLLGSTPLNLSEAGETSPICLEHLNLLNKAAVNFDIWALKMLDSSAKVPSGIFSGNINQYGDFDQCLSIEEPNQLFQGKYCLAYLHPKIPDKKGSLAFKLRNEIHNFQFFTNEIDDPVHIASRMSSILWGFCIPSSCSSLDLENLVRKYLEKTLKNLDFKIQVKVTEERCYVTERNWLNNLPAGTKLTITFLACLLILVITSTLFDLHNKLDESKFSGSLLKAFSLRKNLNYLLSNTPINDEIKSAHGIRFIGLVILYKMHSIVTTGNYPIVNMKECVSILDSVSIVPRNYFAFNDAFLMLAAMLRSFSLTVRKEKLNLVEDFIGRTVPPIVVLIAITAYILPLTGSGPQWNLVLKQSSLCQQHWWRNLLFIPNYFGSADMCLYFTHYMVTDVHFFVLSPLIMYYLPRQPKKTIKIIVGLVALHMLWRFYFSFKNEIYELAVFGMSVEEIVRMFDLMNFIPIYHFGPYAIGILLGYILRRKSIKLTETQVKIGWVLSVLFVVLSFLEPYRTMSKDYVLDPFNAALHTAVSSNLWCLAIGWIFFICETGHTNFLTKILGWRGFALTSKLSYSFYLTQFIMIWYNIGSNRAPVYFTFMSSMIYNNQTSCVILATLILFLFVEMPFCNIKKLLLDKNKKHQHKKL